MVLLLAKYVCYLSFCCFVFLMHINFLSLLSNLVLPSCYFLLSLTLCYLFVVSIVRVNFIISTYFGKFVVCFALIVQLQGGINFPH